MAQRRVIYVCCKESASHKKPRLLQKALQGPGPIRMIPQPTHRTFMRNTSLFMFFFHPDCTVGIGISPIQPRCHHRRSRTGMLPYITASRELHPTPKTHLMHHSITLQIMFGKSFLILFLLWNKCLQFGRLLFIIENSKTRENTERIPQI